MWFNNSSLPFRAGGSNQRLLGPPPPLSFPTKSCQWEITFFDGSGTKSPSLRYLPKLNGTMRNVLNKGCYKINESQTGNTWGESKLGTCSEQTIHQIPIPPKSRRIYNSGKKYFSAFKSVHPILISVNVVYNLKKCSWWEYLDLKRSP